MPDRRVYLDHAATSPVRPEVLEAMLPFLSGEFGNPSGAHRESRRARRALDDARESVAECVGADLGEVVFTSGGTEADDLAVCGGWEAVAARTSRVPGIVCSSVEHHAVLEACRVLARRTGAALTEVPVDGDGVVELDALADACTGDVGLVSVMAVNNEIGTVQPLGRVARIVRERSPDAVLHTDAVQAAPWFPLGPLTGTFDLVTISGHKFGAPKGVGALVARGGTDVVARTNGGGQERGRRSGTQNVAGIVGLSTALARCPIGRGPAAADVTTMRDRLAEGILATVPGTSWTGRGHAAPGFCHLRFPGAESEALVLLFDSAGLAVSAGAACSSGATEASHVLAAIGLDGGDSDGAIRFSLGWSTTEADVDRALSVVPDVVAGLRG